MIGVTSRLNSKSPRGMVLSEIALIASVEVDFWNCPSLGTVTKAAEPHILRFCPNNERTVKFRRKSPGHSNVCKGEVLPLGKHDRWVKHKL